MRDVESRRQDFLKMNRKEYVTNEKQYSKKKRKKKRTIIMLIISRQKNNNKNAVNQNNMTCRTNIYE